VGFSYRQRECGVGGYRAGSIVIARHEFNGLDRRARDLFQLPVMNHWLFNKMEYHPRKPLPCKNGGYVTVSAFLPLIWIPLFHRTFGEHICT
jgi:hypothetical protein